jgi:phospholipid-binding lipoprotein MlaA
MELKKLKTSLLVVIALASMGLAAVLPPTKGEAIVVGGEQISDPFESSNRTILSINEGIDKAVLEPVARGYRYVAPKPVRTSMRNFLRNLKSPVIMGNELLQGDFTGLANATGRLIINTLLGVGGLFDVADMGGIPYQPEDFGQTLATWVLEMVLIS